MALYFYLISSLPDLYADREMPISYGEFLGYCRNSGVSKATCSLLENLTLSSEEGPLIREWAQFYKTLNGELNYRRRQRLGKKDSPPPDRDDSAAQIAEAALAAKNPMEAENILLAYEFENLDELVSLHAFDDVVLFGYAIKLKLLERRNCFEKEKGRAEFKSLFNEIQQRIYSL